MPFLGSRKRLVDKLRMVILALRKEGSTSSIHQSLTNSGCQDMIDVYEHHKDNPKDRRKLLEEYMKLLSRHETESQQKTARKKDLQDEAAVRVACQFLDKMAAEVDKEVPGFAGHGAEAGRALLLDSAQKYHQECDLQTTSTPPGKQIRGHPEAPEGVVPE
jgi:hypothetical protein